jgi:molecular chaperone DnaK (HSP70)
MLVGQAALEISKLDPEATSASFKRWMDEDCCIKLAGKGFSPAELPALALHSLKQDAEHYLGHPVGAAVITVPAYFNTLCAPLLQRLRLPTERALRDAGKRWEEIDELLLLGGATRMAMLRQLVGDMYGRPACHSVDPDRVVALGACVQAALLAEQAAVEDIVMTDVHPFTLGISVHKQLGTRKQGDSRPPAAYPRITSRGGMAQPGPGSALDCPAHRIHSCMFQC